MLMWVLDEVFIGVHVVSSGSPLAPVEGLLTMTDARPLGADEATFIAAVRSGDTARFALITERHRRELQVHCYRMLANYEDAQDMTQETFLRAWNKRESFKGHAALRTWLYRIATNVCLDFLEKRNDRTPVPSELSDSGSEVLYLQPYPDRMLPEDPQESVVARETIELAFIVAVQHLPPRQRAVFILRDVVGWPASKAADALELTVASVTSALQRARVTMREQLPDRRLDWRSPATHELSNDERGVVKSYIDAHERNDLDGLMSLLRDDLRFAMLPEPGTVISGQGRGGRLGLRWALPARLRRLALYRHDGQPHACRRAVPAHPRRPGVPAIRHRGPAHRRREDRRAHRIRRYRQTMVGPAPDTVIRQVPTVDESSARAAVTEVTAE